MASSILPTALPAILSVRDELAESMLDGLVTAESGLGGSAREAEGAGRAYLDESDGILECDASVRAPSVCGVGGSAAGLSAAFAAGGARVCEATPSVRSGGVGDLASTADVEFWACRKRFPRGPSPPASSTMMPTVANKHTAATR